mmetsp:Transcript_25096/g.78797  ORF Transcript_25096/g.78797 Transcript_25096/m.78797 type:complete len:200 (-) Transcript_25096:120-719(-)
MRRGSGGSRGSGTTRGSWLAADATPARGGPWASWRRAPATTPRSRALGPTGPAALDGRPGPCTRRRRTPSRPSGARGRPRPLRPPRRRRRPSGGGPPAGRPRPDRAAGRGVLSGERRSQAPPPRHGNPWPAQCGLRGLAGNGRLSRGARAGARSRRRRSALALARPAAGMASRGAAPCRTCKRCVPGDACCAASPGMAI